LQPLALVVLNVVAVVVVVITLVAAVAAAAAAVVVVVGKWAPFLQSLHLSFAIAAVLIAACQSCPDNTSKEQGGKYTRGEVECVLRDCGAFPLAMTAKRNSRNQNQKKNKIQTLWCLPPYKLTRVLTLELKSTRAAQAVCQQTIWA